MTDRPVTSAEEIELIDFLRVIWKWKYLILGGTLLPMLTVAIISLNIQEVYHISTVLQPGVVKIAEDGEKIYVAKTGTLKALIQEGTFNSRIVKSIKNFNGKKNSRALQFSVNDPARTNTIKIVFKTAAVDEGIEILSHLTKIILDDYLGTVEFFRDEFNRKIQAKRNEVTLLEKERQAIKTSLRSIHERLTVLTSESKILNDNAQLLRQQGKAMINENDGNNFTDLILYVDTIQHNLELKNTYENQIFAYLSQMGEKKFELERIQEKIKIMSQEMEDLKKGKDNIENIKVLEPPTRSLYPVRSKRRKKVTLAAGAGLVIMVFVTFVLEYILRHRRKKV